jgi:hypothetical protein
MDFAREVVQLRDLRRVPLRAVLANWTTGGLWERSRPLGAILLPAWHDGQAIDPEAALAASAKETPPCLTT